MREKWLVYNIREKDYVSLVMEKAVQMQKLVQHVKEKKII